MHLQNDNKECLIQKQKQKSKKYLVNTNQTT
jgi:hypothetical protein